jgi:beta-glucosidase
MFFFFLFNVVVCLSNQENFPFRNESLSFDERVTDLLSRLTLEEKISQMMNESAAIERLGIRKYGWWNEALHGVAGAGLYIFI